MSAGVEKTAPVPMWGAPCDNCDFIIVVDGDGKPVPDPVEWDQFPSCPVCGGTLHFDSQPETMWNRENRLMEGAINQHMTKVRTLVLQSRFNGIPAEVFGDLYELLGGSKEELE